MHSFLDTADNILGLIIMAAIPAYLLLQVWTAVELPSGWRVAALLPLGLALSLIVWCLLALSGYSGFWPLPLVFFAPLGAIYLLGIVGLRRATSADA
jgi:hypothetical protein